MINRYNNSIPASELFSIIQPILNEGKNAVFYVSGMSMWPFICHNRDSVIITKPNPDKLKIGDIVLFRVPRTEKYILHRIVHIDNIKQQIQTAGDGNTFYDGWFPKTSVVAVVTKIIYKNREIPVSDYKYQFLSTIWRKLFPFRGSLLRLLKKISRLKKKNF